MNRRGVGAKHDRAGNLPLFPAIFPDQVAPIVRVGGDGERENFVMAPMVAADDPHLHHARAAPSVCETAARGGEAKRDHLLPSHDELKARRLAVRPNETGAPDRVGAVAFPDSEVEGAWQKGESVADNSGSARREVA